jgi:hypothetical protein
MILGRGRDFIPCHRVQICSEAHPASFPTGTGGSFSGGKAARARSWPLTSIWCRDKNWVEVTPLLQNCMDWCGTTLEQLLNWISLSKNRTIRRLLCVLHTLKVPFSQTKITPTPQELTQTEAYMFRMQVELWSQWPYKFHWRCLRGNYLTI